MEERIQPFTIHPASDVCFDPELIERYGGRGPRYTSYPTALQLNEGFTADDYRAQAAISNREARPLSLYVHIPFCESLCYYCGCNKVVTRNRARIQRYLEHLHREIAMQSALFDAGRVVQQLHFGGGTPTYLGEGQLVDLMAALARCFNLEFGAEREFSIEVDPRSVHGESVGMLADLGFNRLSLGIQDFEPAVQIAVNRLQTVDQVTSIVCEARQYGFRSISFDLIYGLPHQSVAGFDRTLDRVIELRPDRLAIYNYAHLPARFKGQRMIKDEDLPSQATKLEILQHTIEKLASADYCYIGMDHFALAEDDLVLAQKDGTLQRNFQGYSTHGDCDLVGLGASAIGSIAHAFAQNAVSTPEYEALIGSGRLAIQKGIEIDDDDRVRARVIQELMCHGGLDYRRFGNVGGRRFEDYFATELVNLRPLADDGLLRLGPDGIRITPKGRLLLRSVAMVFDRYLAASGGSNVRERSGDNRYSRAI